MEGKTPMPAILNPIIIRILIWFIWRQIQKFGREINWELVKAEFAPRIRRLVPGEEFDETAIFLFDLLIDMIVALIGTKDFPLSKQDVKRLVAEAHNDLIGDALCQYATCQYATTLKRSA
mgnify:CR=1 FL=1